MPIQLNWLRNPFTTEGDLPVAGANGAITRLGIGSVGNRLRRKTGESQPSWDIGETYNVRDFGATGDGSTNDATAFQDALDAANNGSGGVVFFPPATSYLISSTVSANLAKPLVLDLGGQALRMTGGAVLSLAGVAQTALTLDSDATRGDIDITVTDATGVAVGDMLDLSQNTVTETSFSTKRRSLSVVQSVSGDTITLTSPLKIPFAAASTTIARYRHSTPLTVKNGTIEIVSPSTAQSSPTFLRYLRNPIFRDLRVWADQEWISGGPNGWGFDIGNCAGAQFSNNTAEGLSYGISLQNCLSTNVNGYRCRTIRHPIVPATWSVGVRVNNLTTENCYESIDAHAAFDVSYSNVFAANDEITPNLRCVGGSITNATIFSLCDDTDTVGSFHSTLLVDTSWYDQETITLRDVKFITPNRTKNTINASYGRIVLDQVTAQQSELTTALQNTLQDVHIGRCRNPDGTPWKRRAFRKATRVAVPPNLPATLDSGVYHIDPFAAITDSNSGVLRCYGRVFENITTDPIATSIRIHTNAFPETDTPTAVYGVIRLRAILSHANSGVFDILTKDFHFRQASGATGLLMPTTAAYTDGLTGQTNESLTLTVSNPSGQGFTDLGATPDSYAQFDLAISSSRTSPKYGLTYELELIRMT